jgi:hypothetical protein
LGFGVGLLGFFGREENYFRAGASQRGPKYFVVTLPGTALPLRPGLLWLHPYRMLPERA